MSNSLPKPRTELPPEVVTVIFQSISNLKDLNGAALASRLFCQVARRRLFENICTSDPLNAMHAGEVITHDLALKILYLLHHHIADERSHMGAFRKVVLETDFFWLNGAPRDARLVDIINDLLPEAKGLKSLVLRPAIPASRILPSLIMPNLTMFEFSGPLDDAIFYFLGHNPQLQSVKVAGRDALSIEPSLPDPKFLPCVHTFHGPRWVFYTIGNPMYSDVGVSIDDLSLADVIAFIYQLKDNSTPITRITFKGLASCQEIRCLGEHTCWV